MKTIIFQNVDNMNKIVFFINPRPIHHSYLNLDYFLIAFE